PGWRVGAVTGAMVTPPSVRPKSGKTSQLIPSPLTVRLKCGASIATCPSVSMKPSKPGGGGTAGLCSGSCTVTRSPVSAEIVSVAMLRPAGTGSHLAPTSMRRASVTEPAGARRLLGRRERSVCERQRRQAEHREWPCRERERRSGERSEQRRCERQRRVGEHRERQLQQRQRRVRKHRERRVQQRQRRQRLQSGRE